MKRLVSAAAAVFTLFAGAAAAADLPARMPVKAAPIAAQVYDWSGFYIGGNAGWVGANAAGTSDFADGAGVVGDTDHNRQGDRFSGSGFTGGFQAGYNWQVAKSLVLGLETDFDWMRTSYSFCRQTNVNSVPCSDNAFGFESISGQTNWLATTRARVGTTWNQFLFYATGGVAWGNVETTESLSCDVGGCGNSTLRLTASSTASQSRLGWTAGLGAEALITGNWSVKAEWLYVDLGNLTNTFTTTGRADSVPNTEAVVWSRSERYNTVRFGVNYRFGGPAVAQY